MSHYQQQSLGGADDLLKKLCKIWVKNKKAICNLQPNYEVCMKQFKEMCCDKLNLCPITSEPWFMWVCIGVGALLLFVIVGVVVFCVVLKKKKKMKNGGGVGAGGNGGGTAGGALKGKK
ncbi:unnamed protein product [Caenorhabditis sp. 36 PRJEB53466]|nr:unnamed protein product [Caenorhabditis sp. 36 PRJEB53466]